MTAGLAVSCTVAASAGSASAEPRPTYVHHYGQVSGYLEATLPARSGKFHQVVIQAGAEDERAIAEQPAIVAVDVRDYTCPVGFDVQEFASMLSSCTQVGSSSASAEGLIPFTHDVVSRRVTLRGTLTTPEGDPFPLDVTLRTRPEARNSSSEKRVIADSFHTWRVTRGLGGLGRASGTVAGIPLGRIDWSGPSSAYALWDVFKARRWRAGAGAPQGLGWILSQRGISESSVQFSRTGRWGGRTGNLHVGELYVDGDDYFTAADVVTGYECAEPGTADPADPESSGCEAVDEFDLSAGLSKWDMRFGHATRMTVEDGGMLRFRYPDDPTLTVSTTFANSVRASERCLVSGAPRFTAGEETLRLNFDSAKVHVQGCTLQQDAFFDASQ